MTPEELYFQNEPLVRWTIKKYYPDFVDDEDLTQEGRIGLWRACLAYDEKKGLKFSPVAVSYIRNALRHGYEKLSMDAVSGNGSFCGTFNRYMNQLVMTTSCFRTSSQEIQT